MSIQSLSRLIEHDTLGQRSRFERYAADMLYTIAAGMKIDTDKATRFWDQVDKVYENPFDRKIQKKQPYTAEEIKQYLICKLEGREWT